MIVSRLAVALAERFGVDIGDVISRAAPEESSVDIIDPLTEDLSKDKILGCYLCRHELKGWTLNVMATGAYYSETSLAAADIIFIGRSLPATVMVACSNRSIPITRIVEPSATFDPFFLRSDVIVQSVTEFFFFHWKTAHRVPALKLAVTL